MMRATRTCRWSRSPCSDKRSLFRRRVFARSKLRTWGGRQGGSGLAHSAPGARRRRPPAAGAATATGSGLAAFRPELAGSSAASNASSAIAAAAGAATATAVATGRARRAGDGVAAGAAAAAAAAAFFFGDESIVVAEMRGTCLRETSGLTGVAAGDLRFASREAEARRSLAAIVASSIINSWRSRMWSVPGACGWGGARGVRWRCVL